MILNSKKEASANGGIDGYSKRLKHYCRHRFCAWRETYLYLERMSSDIARDLGLSENAAEEQADLYVGVPGNRESILRGIVVKDGVSASDIVQVWLDVSQHPSRGREQADLT